MLVTRSEPPPAGADPTVVMDSLNDAVLRSQRDLFCTVCYAIITFRQGQCEPHLDGSGPPRADPVDKREVQTVGQPGR